MEVFDIKTLQQSRVSAGAAYLEFLRKESLSVGLYELQVGSVDEQEPHTEDEVYFVVRGRAVFREGFEDQAVGPGSVIFVSALKEHRFHSIVEDLSVLVFFAPAEYSRR